MDPQQSPSALPAASLSNLRARAAVLRAIRTFFEDHGYLEVETPLLSRDVCVDAWLEPFELRSGSDRLFLQTSPEFHMKRLLAAGAKKLYQLTRSFRGGERGPLHNPEFTILEWYAVGETYRQQMNFVERLIRSVAETDADGEPKRHELPSGSPFERLSYDDAFAEFAGTPVLALTTGELRELAVNHGIPVPASLSDDDRDGWLNLLLSTLVEPALARRGAVFLYDYPASQAALARVREARPSVAERFELYLDGIEICNGFQELTDADELDRRMRSQAARRQREGLAALPVQNQLTHAMRKPGLPECSGVALGVDRLVMWRLKREHFDDVLAFPGDRA